MTTTKYKEIALEVLIVAWLHEDERKQTAAEELGMYSLGRAFKV